MTTPSRASVASTDLLSFGEAGEWLVALGHVDLAEFEAAALQYLRVDLGYGDDYELPADPRHRWMRPARRSDLPAGEEGEQQWKVAQDDDWQWWCDTAEDGAEPITIVDTEW